MIDDGGGSGRGRGELRGSGRGRTTRSLCYRVPIGSFNYTFRFLLAERQNLLSASDIHKR